ncbi:MAG: hypothetical protein MMC23_009454 [Stictis urceolatum]|nr:hypothetical protein [Stictis urceolata]
MVSTRNHPSNFPPPDLSPTKSSSPSSPSAPSTRSRRRTTKPKGWLHTPSHLTLGWLLISLPLVIWDTGYVLLRPHSMPGGKLHWPIWEPYGLYGSVDYIYGFPAWEASNGFTAAQAALNVVETVMYLGYLYLVGVHGVESGRVDGRGATKALGWLGAGRVVGGREAGVAVLIGFSASVMTLSKTVLYWANEAFSGWHNIGHNDLFSLVFMWIIPNGAWLILPTYMTYVFAAEILEGLTAESSKSTPLAIKDE